MEIFLRKEGYRPETTSDPLDAVARFEADEEYDGMLVDLMMPKLGGIEVLEQVKALARQTPRS
jgi:CheY-like chemotaxis protein